MTCQLTEGTRHLGSPQSTEKMLSRATVPGRGDVSCREAAAEPQERALGNGSKEAEPESRMDSDSSPTEIEATKPPAAERRQVDIPPWRGHRT